MAADVGGPAHGTIPIRAIGPFALAHDSGLSPSPTRQVARVGALLASRPGEVVERERIIRALWPQDLPATAENTLQAHVSGLRRMIGRDRVEHADGGYRLIATVEEVDVHAFERLVGCGGQSLSEGNPQAAVGALQTALQLWRGRPFADVHDAEIDGHRARLAEFREQAIEYHLEASLALAQGRVSLDRVVAAAREQIARRPQRIAAHRILIAALETAGRDGEVPDAREASWTAVGVGSSDR